MGAGRRNRYRAYRLQKGGRGSAVPRAARCGSSAAVRKNASAVATPATNGSGEG